MGIVKIPKYTMHWESEGLWNRYIVVKTMSSNRIKAIGRYLAVGTLEKENKIKNKNTF